MSETVKMLQEQYGSLILTTADLAHLFGKSEAIVRQQIEDGTFPIPCHEETDGTFTANVFKAADVLDGKYKPGRILKRRRAPTIRKVARPYICGMLSLDKLRSTKQDKVRRITGIYFLWKADDLVYVGQSVNILSRLSSHTDKDWDSFSYIETPGLNQFELETVEHAYIAEHRPKYNRSCTNHSKQNRIKYIRNREVGP